jgi:hypothetical protein
MSLASLRWHFGVTDHKYIWLLTGNQCWQDGVGVSDAYR